MNSISDQAPNRDAARDSGEKPCKGCGKCFPATPEYFSRDKKGKLGLHYWCKVCTRAAGQRYKKQNRAEVIAYNKRWDAEHREELLDYKKQYRETHKKEIASYLRQYREENAEAIAEDKRRYDLVNPEKRLQRGHKRRSKERGAGGTYTEADLSNLYALQEGCCCWCGKPLVNRLTDKTTTRHTIFTIDHVRPIHRQGTNWAWNLVLVCRQCNSSHGARLVFLEWQPPAMLEWMGDYIIKAMVLEFLWQTLQWKIKISFR